MSCRGNEASTPLVAIVLPFTAQADRTHSKYDRCNAVIVVAGEFDDAKLFLRSSSFIVSFCALVTSRLR